VSSSTKEDDVIVVIALLVPMMAAGALAALVVGRRAVTGRQFDAELRSFDEPEVRYLTRPEPHSAARAA
jgi:hypothetical protein